ncbi:MAG: papain-like cysteine protease family protein [Anaerolineales bacterium]|nr:papain-like cysteine protease family protein [Anaerolineales bacterium]
MMHTWKRFLIAATAAVAALAFWTAAVHAGCGDGVEDCPVDPPQSRQVVVSRHAGEQSAAADPYALPVQPAPFSMPLPAVLEPISAAPSSNTQALPNLNPIEVRLRSQDPSDVSCGVQALGMALDGLQGEAPSSAAILDYLTSHDYLYEFGTGAEELARAAQSFGYGGSVAFHGWNLEQLRAELDAGRPLVVDLGANGPDQPGHFVTLTGIAEDWSQVAYSDPILGERVVSLAEFMRLWDLQGNSGVAVAGAPPAVGSPDYAPWTALFAAMMATLALGPGVLTDTRRRGVGGAIVSGSETTGTSTGDSAKVMISKEKPSSAPPGKMWIKGGQFYDQRTEVITVYDQVPNMVWKDIQVGTRTVTEKVPRYVTVTEDKGHWEYKRVKKTKWETQFAGYTYKTKWYPTPSGWKKSVQKVPKYKKVKKVTWKKVKHRWIPRIVEKQVQRGHYVIERDEPVYEKQYVQDGLRDIPRQKEITINAPTGMYEWTLVDDPASVAINEEPLPVETANMDWDPFRANPGGNFPTKEMYLQSLFEDDFQPQLRQATGNMHFRAEPSGDSEHLAWISAGDYFYYTGATITVNGTNWKSIAMMLNGEMTHGWVIAGYQQTVDPADLIVPDNSLAARDATLEYYWYHMSQAERQALIDSARLEVDALRAEIQRITSTLRPGDVFGDILAEAADVLLGLPDWYLSGGIPSSYFERSTLTPEVVEAFRTLLSLSDHLITPPTEETWRLASQVYGVTEADLLLHILDDATWPAGESTSVGDFPINLFVTRRYGHYLYAFPDPDSANVSEAFLGVPQGEKVVWNGNYHIGVDDEGNSCVYYQVSWTFNGNTYTGWIPGEHLAPEIEEVDHYSPLIYGNWPINTFGYEDSNGWSAYHAGGAAQNLNLFQLFKDMGYP